MMGLYSLFYTFFELRKSDMKNIYLGLKFSFSYFSILPVHFKTTDDLSQKNVLRYMLIFLPFIGFILSSISITIYQFMAPSWYLALLCSSLYMILYGFLHTEAIADVADALYAQHSNKNSYDVIKDSTIGAMGLLYTIIFVILKVASLTYLFLHNFYLEIIVIAILSRLSIIISIYFYEFKSTFVNLLKHSLDKISLVISVVSYIFITMIFMGFKSYLLIFLSLCVSYIFISKTYKKLGFINGDILGANLELNELIMFIAVALMI
jgi:adenosylcobinamide-GDP ribazoletransferase